MLFSLGWVSLISSQKTKYLKAFRVLCSNRAFKSRLLKELVHCIIYIQSTLEALILLQKGISPQRTRLGIN